ncbi:MAG TPA: hypothetical protein VGI45_34085 [Terracidiphilus sp.]|jgi:hypothetical protein
MKLIDHARLVQSLQDTSQLVACNIDPEKHPATQQLQRSIAMLLGELNRDWSELVPRESASPSVGIPD